MAKRIGWVVPYFSYLDELKGTSEVMRRCLGSALATWKEASMDVLIVEWLGENGTSHLDGIGYPTFQVYSSDLIYQLSRCHNIGFDVLSEGPYDYLGWIDGDTTVPPDYLDRLEPYLDQGYDAIHGMEHCVHHYSDQTVIHRTYLRYLDVSGVGVSWIYRKASWKECPLWDLEITSGDDTINCNGLLSDDGWISLTTRNRTDDYLETLEDWETRWRSAMKRYCYLHDTTLTSLPQGSLASRNFSETNRAVLLFEPRKHIRTAGPRELYSWTDLAPDELVNLTRDRVIRRNIDKGENHG